MRMEESKERDVAIGISPRALAFQPYEMIALSPNLKLNKFEESPSFQYIQHQP